MVSQSVLAQSTRCVPLSRPPPRAIASYGMVRPHKVRQAPRTAMVCPGGELPCCWQVRAWSSCMQARPRFCDAISAPHVHCSHSLPHTCRA